MIIGILTFHCAYNFGAMLQCYALQEYISSIGHSVQVINYRPKYLESQQMGLKNIIRHPLSSFRQILNGRFLFHRDRFEKFEKFERQYFNLTSKVKSKTELNKIVANFDYVVFGSDQIWCEKFNGNDSIWYGDFTKNGKTKFISYAASAGDVVFSENGHRLMDLMNSKFDAISVRELKLVTYLKGKAKLVLDPTLLVPNEVCQKWFNTPTINKKYVLVRQARQDKNIYKIARHIAKQLDTIVITADAHKSSFDLSDEVLCCSPSDFVGLIKNSLCVVANSFHGITISISCHIPFYAVRVHDDGDGRIINLLEKLDLTNRLLDGNEMPSFEAIDYSIVEDKLSVLRTDSQNFLIDSIK